MSSKILRKFINTCSITFKAYEHEVVISKNKANLWHFSTTMSNGKKFMVYCAPQLGKVRSIVKIALKKIPADSRLVVICENLSDKDRVEADTQGYCLVDIGTLQKYGTDMIDAKMRDAA